ncbi:uncharacterized protein [Battus philenor]|uniref:uncharacterized protein n=1 Tax=Battus philenor TaxID=42288 RepID=UPI0035CF6727
MPEKPKKRKNNRNKRKNKNGRGEFNSNNNTSSNAIESQSTGNIDETGRNDVNLKEETSFIEEQIFQTTADTDMFKKPERSTSHEVDESVRLEILNVESKECIKNSNMSQMIHKETDIICKSPIENIESRGLKLNSNSPIAAHTRTVEDTCNTYIVESPDQIKRNKTKLLGDKKSKSVDDDETPRIIEITDEHSSVSNDYNVVDENSVLISDTDSDIKWENTFDIEEHNLPKVENPIIGTLSVSSIPLTVANCEQAKLLSAEEELSLRRYLQTLNLSTNPSTSLEIKTEIEQIVNSEIKHRLRKKGLTDEAFSQKLCAPRILDVIDEEVSGESSVHSRRHSYLSDKKSDNEELEDDVFEQPSSRSSSKKQADSFSKKNFSSLQKPQKCVLVGAKLKEPEISEARGGWTVQTVEKMTGAEIVYLTDSSSSTSSIYDVGEDAENDHDTDVTIRMITPTIEVTDTENFLKKTYTSDNSDNLKDVDTAENNILLPLKSNESPSNSVDKVCRSDEIEKSTHEVVVTTTSNLKTNLTVKDIDNVKNNTDCLNHDKTKLDNTTGPALKYEHKPISSQHGHDYDLEMKVLKCELNDAINNLIKEVSEAENVDENSKETFSRQDSSSSISSSQCTAIYNPNSSLVDITNNDESCQFGKDSKEVFTTSHVNDVIERITNLPESQNNIVHDVKQPQNLRDMCVEKISSFPYGLKILEELANVSLRLQSANNLENDFVEDAKYYEVNRKEINRKTDDQLNDNLTNRKSDYNKEHSVKIMKIEKYAPPLPPPPIPPPPLIPRNSSLKKTQDSDSSFDTKTIEKPYICLSPSQKMLMEKTNTVFSGQNVAQTDRSEKNSERENIENQKQTVKKHLKSQTGSRLMALIRDPAISNTINTSLNKFDDKRLYSEHKIKTDCIQTCKKYNEPTSKFCTDNSKPIPPPRPRKLITSFYENDTSSDFAENSFKSMKKEKKFFHFSTGNLSKEIEDDISTIQNLHRNYINLKNHKNDVNSPRRPSLPKDLCDQQMEYIRKKEKEVEAEIRRLEGEKLKTNNKKGPRAPMITEKEIMKETGRSPSQKLSTKGMLWNTQITDKTKISSVFSSSQEELLREKMYSEYLNEIAEREQRKHHKVIKITNTPLPTDVRLISKSMSALDVVDSRVNNRIEEEFISKARERWDKLGIRDPESEDERSNEMSVYREPKVIEHKIRVIEAGKEKDVHRLPTHLQEFVTFTAKDKEQDAGRTETVMIAPTFKARSTSPAVWRPGASAQSGSPSESPGATRSPSTPQPPPPPPPPVWTPTASPQTPRKSFRPVHFEDTPPARRKFSGTEQNGCTSGSESEGRLKTSQSAPVTGLSALGGTGTSRLPRAQNPTVTLLQKARENQISRASNIQERDPRLPRDRPSPPAGDPVHALRKGYLSEGETDRREYSHGGGHKMADANRKVEGIGPTTKEGMPVALRSEVKDPSRWYKKMYDTIHKNKFDDDYVTIRYKNRQGQPPLRVSSSKSQYAYFDPRSGYLSEPEGGLSRLGSSTWSDAYDSDATAGPRRRTASVQEDRREDFFSPYLPNNKYSTLASARASQEVYKNQPGKIENYMPGKSSVIDKEAKQQNVSSTTSLPQTSPKEKKEVTSMILSKSNMARALKESGYESDSTLVFRRRGENDAPLSPAERRAAYKDLQAGGEPPLRGFRSPAPPRQDESEIEYIPISSTLTKIRVHKKTPNLHEVICYPITNIETSGINATKSSGYKPNRPDVINDYPPAPPRRISSKNSETLKLVISSRNTSISPNRTTAKQTNVRFLKNQLSNKLNRQNTHVIIKKDTKLNNCKLSTPVSSPANKKSGPTGITTSTSKNIKCAIGRGTSSFCSPRRTLQPTEYTSRNKCGDLHTSIVIENGAGRKTPISNILDKVTSLDKLWSSQKRNDQINTSKYKEKSNNKTSILPSVKSNSNKITSSTDNKTLPRNVTHKSRDMIRTSEKLQKIKVANTLHKPNSAINVKNISKYPRLDTIQTTANISKSTSNIPSTMRKQSNVRTAVVTNLKKRRSVENVIVRPKSVPCHESCSKKPKGDMIKRETKLKSNKRDRMSYESNFEFHEHFNHASDYNRNKSMIQKPTTTKELKKTHGNVCTDSFFRHLFLGATSAPVVSTIQKNTMNTVQEKAKLFQSLPQIIHHPSNYFNSYLIHRKPVSLSRFKAWDKHYSPTRISSPRSISWPGRMDGEIRKFQSLSKSDKFGSMSSLSTIRSKSEPPTNKIYFSQTSRPVSPNVVFFKKEKGEEKPTSPSKIIYLQSKKSIDKSNVSAINKNIKQNEKTLSSSKDDLTGNTESAPCHNVQIPSKKTKTDDRSPVTIFFSQTARPISPKVVKNTISKSRSQSSSPVSLRSPSYRRIHNARILSKQISCSIKNGIRTRSVDDNKKTDFFTNNTVRPGSDANLYCNDPDYEEYILDIRNSKPRTERFRELNRYYAYLERVAVLEKATSASDLRLRRKDEEIIDFDRWKKIRAIERAEEELNNLYNKLKMAQSENNVLFYPKDVNDFRWDSCKERGLRVKEKSVEDLKEEFKQKPHLEQNESSQTKDYYKPLWRGTSVAETAFNINRKNESNDKNSYVTIKPKVTVHQDTHSSLSEVQKKLGLGNRLWSSLSREQVSSLKRQLNAIYSKELESKANKDNENYTVEVKQTKNVTKPSLTVRCNSLTTSPTTLKHTNELSKSDSIAAITCPITSEKEIKNNVNKMQMTLSEIEKKKISQSLSKEVLNRINKYDVSLQNSLKKEQRNNIDCDKRFINSELTTKSQPDPENKTPDLKTECNVDETRRHVVYPVDNTETIYQYSTSETETGSSDISNKTAIYTGPGKEVLRKVEYFESVNNIIKEPKCISQTGENSNEHNISSQLASPRHVNCNELEQKVISQSQSCTNFRELFGEVEKNKFLSLPLKPDLYSRSPSPYSELCINDRRTPDTPRYSSDEAIWRSRTPSPDPERYWRAYIKLARAGEVRRIARRFDSPSAAGAVLRKHRSDPEIARNVLNKEWSSVDRNLTQRKCRAVLPVARVPLRPTNRFMPHIDVISKLAALRKRSSPRSRSAEEVLECRPGEVERIRKRFETISLLGPIYSSVPDVRELDDIAPYLAGSWIAHRYPKPSDNNRTIENPTKFIKDCKLPNKKEIKQATSNDSVKLNSILKNEVLAKQQFDPSVHRPASRYEPPRAPPRPPPASWPFRLAPFVTQSRHTVTFQENDSAPEPPRRIPHGSYSDTESPGRRYLESDVNIHYRCPVRQEPLPLVPERELARQQAEHMKRLYREQKRNKYLQEKDIHLFDIEAFDASIKELQDMQNRRHQDNFMPSQKTVVPLNRYDEAEKLVARALYAFNGQTTRELSFKKGDMINVRRQIDSNWYEGEVHGRIGLFPYNYVEILKGDYVNSPKKPVVMEGQARAKFDFTAQTNLELPLKKGEIVVLTRRIDHNWWEGRNGTKTGIFPDSYVTVLQEPSQSIPSSAQLSAMDKPAASPAAHGLLNGAARRGLQQHSYTPQHNSPALANAPPATAPLPGYLAKPVHSALTPSERGYGPAAGGDLNNAEPLYVDTNAEAVPYRAMYKYRPQNPDELELQEGDTVYVLEKCDDGWYVGSSQRTGRFGTFPGNYVERI